MHICSFFVDACSHQEWGVNYAMLDWKRIARGYLSYIHLLSLTALSKDLPGAWGDSWLQPLARLRLIYCTFAAKTILHLMFMLQALVLGGAVPLLLVGYTTLYNHSCRSYTPSCEGQNPSESHSYIMLYPCAPCYDHPSCKPQAPVVTARWPWVSTLSVLLSEWGLNEPCRCLGCWKITMSQCFIHWIGLRENLQETMVFTIKYGGFL